MLCPSPSVVYKHKSAGGGGSHCQEESTQQNLCSAWLAKVLSWRVSCIGYYHTKIIKLQISSHPTTILNWVQGMRVQFSPDFDVG